MRHKVRGRKLGRNASHRKAMFRNMACSLIKTVRFDEDDPQRPRVPGRIVTTVPKAKELRPFVEKLITLARKAAEHEAAAAAFATDADKGSDAYQSWRKSDEWQKWSAAISPAVALRRRAFSMLRDKEAVSVLFDELAERFAERDGGYTRIVRLAEVRLGDAGAQALIEFVGERDRVKPKKRSAPVVEEETVSPAVAEEPAAEASDESAEEAAAESTEEETTEEDK
ncbi:MAG: 50S ribosomal protein L17 [Planctomycetaceae bacterium]|nr:50S ribosomal protein L17 [Planctomycetaceae bacterium]